MRQYRITYKQKFMGKILQESYVKSVSTERELQNAIDTLYEDPHVYSVDYEELEGE